MRTYRFAFTGAQASGKSTLCRDLEAILTAKLTVACQILGGIGGKIAAQGYPLGEGATMETVCAFAKEHLERERGAVGPIVIQDRCLLDLLAYAEVLCTGPPEFRAFLGQVAKVWVGAIDKVFLTKLPAGAIRQEKARESDEFRRRIEESIQEVAIGLGIQLEIVDRSNSLRREQVLAVIKRIASEVFIQP